MRFALLAPLVLLVLLCVPLHAQDMFKCKDARGGVVYSNQTCEKQGLAVIGTVQQDRVMIVPGTPVAKPAAKVAEKADKGKSAKDDDADDARKRRADAIRPINAEKSTR